MLEDLADKELSKLTLGIMNDLLGSKSHIAMDDIEQGQLVGYVDGSVIPIATGGHLPPTNLGTDANGILQIPIFIGWSASASAAQAVVGNDILQIPISIKEEALQIEESLRKAEEDVLLDKLVEEEVEKMSEEERKARFEWIDE